MPHAERLDLAALGGDRFLQAEHLLVGTGDRLGGVVAVGLRDVFAVDLADPHQQRRRQLRLAGDGGKLDDLRALDRIDDERRLQAEDRVEAEFRQVVAGGLELFGDALDDRPAGERLHLGEEGLLAILRRGLDPHRPRRQGRRQRHARRRDLQPRRGPVLGRPHEVPGQPDSRGDEEHGKEDEQPAAIRPSRLRPEARPQVFRIDLAHR